MYCPRCGQQVDPSTQAYCPQCGQRLGASEGAPPPRVPTGGQPVPPWSAPQPPVTAWSSEQHGGVRGEPPPPRGRRGLLRPLVIVPVLLACCVFAALVLNRMSQSTPRQPASTGIALDDSLTGSSRRWPQDANCTYRADGYHIVAAYICYAPVASSTDGTVSVQVRQVAGTSAQFYGLVLRRPTKGNYYAFSIDGAGRWRFQKVINGLVSEVVPATSSTAVRPGLNAMNTLTVQMQGSHFTFTINGTKVGEANDAALRSGLVGLEGHDGIDVVYTNFVLHANP